MTLSAGSLLGPYVIVSAIGAGRMGEVYQARGLRLSREVAIKVRPPGVANSRWNLQRSLRWTVPPRGLVALA